MDSHKENEETIEEEKKEPELTPTQLLVQSAETPETVAKAIKDIVADSRLHKSKRQFVDHNSTLRRLTRMERSLTSNYGVKKDAD